MRLKYKFKQRPYPHQVAAIRAALPQLKKTGGFALLMEPRTGKTKTAIDLASILHEAGHVSRVLVLCPLGVMDVWEDEIKKNCPEKYRITMWDKKGRKKQGLPPFGTSRLDFVIMNPDAFSTPGSPIFVKMKQGTYKTKNGLVYKKLPNGKYTKMKAGSYQVRTSGIYIKTRRRSRTRGGKWEIQRALNRWKPQLVIADESHRFKSPNAAKTRMLHSVKIRDQADYRLILTGTLQTKKKRVVDIWAQFMFMNKESPLVKGLTAGDFKQKYAVWTQRNGYPQWLRNRNIDRMRRLLHAEAYSITRKEAYGEDVRLPDQIVPVDLSGHTRELYEEMALDMIARIKTGEITEASIPLVQSLRLSQITSGLAKTTPTDMYPDPRLLRVGRDKLNALQDLCSDWFEADEHVVVGARFRADIQGVRAMCKKLKVPCFEIHGGIKGRVRRTEMYTQFNKQVGPACIIIQPAASSLGIDLRSASIFVWFSLTNSWVDFTQAEDRNALNPDPRSYVYLLARGTVDYLMYESMQEDGEIGRLVMKAPERLWIPPT